jgi:hypothetical protein
VYRDKFFPEYKSTWREFFLIIEVLSNNKPHCVDFGQLFMGEGNRLQTIHDSLYPFRVLNETQIQSLHLLQSVSE